MTVPADCETAPAKINLALHVRARRGDGYHDIESLFVFAEDGDLLSAEPAETLSLAVAGPFAGGLDAGANNLVLLAARALQAATGTAADAALRLDKRLPVAAGLGGGSADAAAALRLLTRLWRLEAGDSELMEIAAGLGADVPACLAGRTLRGEGRGDALSPIDGEAFAGLPLLLVNPGMPLATAAVFAGWDGVDRGPLDEGDPLAAARAGRNDLEAPAIALVPEIATLLDTLRALPGVVFARMSGSGATCFALFGDEAALALGAAAIRAKWPGYWCLETRLR